MKNMLVTLPDNLTSRDKDILNILWNSEEAMTASQIANAEESLTINTVQAVLRKLLKLELIRIDNIVYSGTVLCRNYRPAISADEFALSQFRKEYLKVQDRISISSLLAALLGNETDDQMNPQALDELQKFLDEYKK